MSDVVDLPMVMLQKAQHAAEAAAASASMLGTEAGLRLAAIEARLVGVEGRLSSMYNVQSSQTLALMRMADIQSEHTATLAEHTAILTEHTARFDKIDQTLAQILARLPEKS